MSDPTLSELRADLADPRARDVLSTWFTAAQVVDWYGCGLRAATRLLRDAAADGLIRQDGRDREFHRPLYCRAGDPAGSPSRI